MKIGTVAVLISFSYFNMVCLRFYVNCFLFVMVKIPVAPFGRVWPDGSMLFLPFSLDGEKENSLVILSAAHM